ncbi:2'-5' RNA ligase family protein [Pleomorphomonas koreensis]|uniref:2'-5' RNA ligase family protein n=1 Tax=Pleomorphomonas koreensis TaxID=257440 RepID=UPI0004262A14|nr:2'-5' RNA ligase family protein [Pleomorphomonas koreensis]
MPYAISVKSAGVTAANIVRMWDEASVFEPVGSMRELNYPPHLTLAVFPEYPGEFGAIIAEVFSSQDSLRVTFEGVRYFDNDLLVLWAKPCSNEALLNLHATLHSHIDPLACDEHYRVGRWVPHCSLATRVPQSAKSAAIKWAESKTLDFSVVFDLVDFVEFPPVVVHRELRLR